jgi:ketosteroid isomerase-like protein
MEDARSNVEIVFAGWLDAIRRGDLDALERALAPDAVHAGVEPGMICRGRAEIAARLGRRGAAVPDVEALELVAAGERVVVSLRGRGLGPPDANGEPCGEAHLVFTLAGGSIVRIDDHRDRAAALAAAGAAAPW